jgi:hypothetical protein
MVARCRSGLPNVSRPPGDVVERRLRELAEVGAADRLRVAAPDLHRGAVVAVIGEEALRQRHRRQQIGRRQVRHHGGLVGREQLEGRHPLRAALEPRAPDHRQVLHAPHVGSGRPEGNHPHHVPRAEPLERAVVVGAAGGLAQLPAVGPHPRVGEQLLRGQIALVARDRLTFEVREPAGVDLPVPQHELPAGGDLPRVLLAPERQRQVEPTVVGAIPQRRVEDAVAFGSIGDQVLARRLLEIVAGVAGVRLRAGGGREGPAPVDGEVRQRHELVVPANLLEQQHPLDPLQSGRAEVRAEVPVEPLVGAGRVRAAPGQRGGRVDAVLLVELEAHGEQPAEQHVVAVLVEVVLVLARQGAARADVEVPLGVGVDGLVVLEREPGEEAEDRHAELEPAAHRGLQPEVRRHGDRPRREAALVDRLPDLLELRRREARVEQVAFDELAVAGGLGEAVGQPPIGQPEPEVLGGAALLGPRRLEGRGAGPPAGHRELVEPVFGDAARLEDDEAPAELAGQIGRPHLLDRDRLQHPGREQVEGHDAPLGLGRRQRRQVEQRARVAVAEAADEHEPAVDDREAGDAVERGGGGRVAGLRHLLGAEHLGDDRRVAALLQRRVDPPDHLGGLDLDLEDVVVVVDGIGWLRAGVRLRRGCRGDRRGLRRLRRGLGGRRLGGRGLRGRGLRRGLRGRLRCRGLRPRRRHHPEQQARHAPSAQPQ